jgi:hypothetical protein
MTLRVVGAGLGRTGTHSLKTALEQLLSGRCYHMLEVVGRPDDVPIWHGAAKGEPVDWHALFSEFDATVDWPSAAFWKPISEAFPDAVILLSSRPSEDWWKSVDRTIFEGFRPGNAEQFKPGPWADMIQALMDETFTPDLLEKDKAIAAYEAHNADVRATAPADRLVEWHPGDGWGPLCEALGVPVPDEPYPHTNSTAEFRARAGWD